MGMLARLGYPDRLPAPATANLLRYCMSAERARQPHAGSYSWAASKPLHFNGNALLTQAPNPVQTPLHSAQKYCEGFRCRTVKPTFAFSPPLIYFEYHRPHSSLEAFIHPGSLKIHHSGA